MIWTTAYLFLNKKFIINSSKFNIVYPMIKKGFFRLKLKTAEDTGLNRMYFSMKLYKCI